MRTIKLMADYHCFPLWEVPGDHVGNIDPDSLLLSDSLKIKILNWTDVYDATLNIDDPAISGFLNIGAAADFEAQGLNLADKIREELGPDFKVLFSAKAYIKSLRS